MNTDIKIVQRNETHDNMNADIKIVSETKRLRLREADFDAVFFTRSASISSDEILLPEKEKSLITFN